MSKTISSSNYTTGFFFANASDSPLTVASGVTVSNSGGFAIGSTLSSYVSIANAGTVVGSSYGIYLASAGAVSNLGTGHITGRGGILGEADLTLYNAANATIDGQAYAVGFFGSGSVVNLGIIQSTSDGGVYLGLGGSVTNQPGGTIEGSGYGVNAPRGAATVVNHGSISSSHYAGILLKLSGSVTNSGHVTGYKYGINAIGHCRRRLQLGLRGQHARQRRHRHPARRTAARSATPAPS